VAPTVEFAKQQGLDAEGADETLLMGDFVGKTRSPLWPGNHLLERKFFYGQLYFDQKGLLEKNIPPALLAGFIRKWALSTGKFHAAFTREELLAGQVRESQENSRSTDSTVNAAVTFSLIYKPYILNSTAKTGTTHFSPFSYDTHVPVLFYGPQFREGRYADEFYITDIVPTLSSALHIDVPAVLYRGKPFIKILAAP